MRTPAVLIAFAVTMLGGACSGGESVLECTPYSQGEVLIMDHGKRNLEGQLLNQVKVEDGDKTYIALNVDGTIISVVEDGLTASLDNESEAATSLPVDPRIGSIDEPGAKRAIECARSGETPTSSAPASGFDVEEWRSRAIEKFGPEQTYDDGSKDDYVEFARSTCKEPIDESIEYPADGMMVFIFEEFCPFL